MILQIERLNHLTVRKSVARLVSEGFIERRVGAGSFVRDPAAKPAGLRSVALVVQDMLTASAVPLSPAVVYALQWESGAMTLHFVDFSVI